MPCPARIADPAQATCGVRWADADGWALGPPVRSSQCGNASNAARCTPLCAVRSNSWMLRGTLLCACLAAFGSSEAQQLYVCQCAISNGPPPPGASVWFPLCAPTSPKGECPGLQCSFSCSTGDCLNVSNGILRDVVSDTFGKVERATLPVGHEPHLPRTRRCLSISAFAPCHTAWAPHALGACRMAASTKRGTRSKWDSSVRPVAPYRRRPARQRSHQSWRRLRLMGTATPLHMGSARWRSIWPVDTPATCAPELT
jgi:hypothetical protein